MQTKCACETIICKGSDIAPTLTEKMAWLHKYYNILIKVYEARMKHRKYSLVPQCYDPGHNIQFELIKNKINECEHKLEELYHLKLAPPKLVVVKVEEVTDELHEKEENTQNINNVMQQIRKFKQTRKKQELEDISALNAYIDENKRIQNNKVKLVEELIIILRSYVEINLTYMNTTN